MDANTSYHFFKQILKKNELMYKKKIWMVIFLGEKNVVVFYTLPRQGWTSPKFFILPTSCSIIFAAIFCFYTDLVTCVLAWLTVGRGAP